MRPRFGYPRLYILLRREGWHANRKKVYRLYREEGLLVRTRRRKKSAAHVRAVPEAPTEPNERWAMDFVADRLASGHKIRALTLIDLHSRECLAIEVAPALRARDVTATLERVIEQRGRPKIITTDNGTEFTSNHFDAWAYANGIKIDFIHPGRPVENGHIESFNGRLRDECLSANWFLSLEDARTCIEEWRIDYNHVRPHSSLGHLPPATYVASGKRPVTTP